MKKKTAILICSVLSLMLSQNVVLASENQEEDIQKDETVYAILHADGSVDHEIISSWIHSDSGIKDIKETLHMQNVENLKGEEEPSVNGNQYTWNVEGNDVYYRGSSEKQLPIEVNITYILDGKERNPQDLVGKSGKLKIHITMTNTSGTKKIINGKETTIHPLYLAAGMIDFSSDHFHNVNCQDGKVLSDGNNQIVTFVALPGFEDTLQSAGIADIEELPIHDTYVIEADVEDFEMGPIMIAMTPEVPLDQLKDIDSLSELVNGLAQLNSAGEQLLEGSEQLSDATVLFADKMNELKNKVTPLGEGVSKLDQGMVQLYQGSSELSHQLYELSEGIAKVKEGSEQLYQGIKQLPQMNAGIVSLKQGARDLYQGVLAVSDGISTLNDKAVNSGQLRQLETVLSTLKGFQPLIANLSAMVQGLNQLDTSLNSGNLNPSDPANPLPSVSAYAQSNATQTTQSAADMAAFCQSLQDSGADGGVVSQCGSIANEMAVSARDAGIINAMINGNGTQAGIAQQVNAMNQQLSAFDPDALYQLSEQMSDIDQVTNSLQELEQGIASLATAMPQLSHGADQLSGGIDQLYHASSQLGALSDGIEQLHEGTITLHDGSKQLYQGSLTLNQGLSDAKAGTNQLIQSTPSLLNGINQLSDASATLAEKTKLLYEGVNQFKLEGLDVLHHKVSSVTGQLDLILQIKDEIIAETENVHSFSGAPEHADSKVKFIYKTAEIKAEKTK